MQPNSSTLVSFQMLHRPEHGGDPVISQEVFSILEELADEDDPGLVAELVELFLDDSATRVSSIAEAMETADLDAIGAAAHALKSSSANVGAMAFSQSCAKLEAAARGGEQDTAVQIAEAALAMYQDVRGAFSPTSPEEA